MSSPFLYPLVDSFSKAKECLESFFCRGTAYLPSTHNQKHNFLLQLRIKNQPLSTIRTQALEILDLKQKYPFTFILNDNPLLAHEINADGVHLGQEDMTVADARKILGPDKIIGLSSHSLEEAQEALTQDIDYLACGAIFKTTNKPEDHPIVDLETLRKIVNMSSKPVIAIGGITPENLHSVLKTGIAGVAFISSLEKIGEMQEVLNQIKK